MKFPDFSLSGQKAIVTGASTGIGRGIALGLAKAGFNLIINGVQDDPSTTQGNAFKVKELAEKEGVQVEVCIADVSSGSKL